MNTNFHMLRNFEYNPKDRGFCTSEEIDMIEQHFMIKDRSDVELQNLRDFVVLFYSSRMSSARDDDYDAYMKLNDTMSAITGVIDLNKAKRGMAV